MIINSRTRSALAFVSTCGFIASVTAFTLTLFGWLPDQTFPWLASLFIGVALVFLPVFLVEYPASREPAFLYKGFAKGLPKWVAPCEWILQLVALAQFIWFLKQSGFGVPAIQGGQYVIESHGQILAVISAAEYTALSKAWLRMILTILASFYFVPMMYWWFQRNGQTAEKSNDKKNEIPR